MNDDSGNGRRSGRRQTGPPRSVLRRTVALAAVITATSLLAAACGSTDPAPTSKKQATYQDMLAYAQCMRAHGEPNFPDPQPNGGMLIDAQKDHLNGALMNAADRACQHLMPKMTPMTPAQQRKVTAEALRFVACMRAHGLPNMPDPVVNAQGIQLQLGQPGHHGPRVSSQILQAAQQACQRYLPGAPP